MTTYLTIEEAKQHHAISLGASVDALGRLFVPAGSDLTLFKTWLPTSAGQNALVTAPKGISLTDLLARAGAAIDNAFPRPEWVRIEISNLTIHTSGHVYIDAIDRDENAVALSKSRAVMWRAQANKIGKKFLDATGRALGKGLKVLVLIQPEFTEQHGFQLIITDVDPSYTIGDMAERLKRIREALDHEGESDKNKNLPTPLDFMRVAVLAPESAAGLGDFNVTAHRLAAAGLCTFTYFYATFQGESTKASLKQAFIDANDAHGQSPFDALVMIRGGGAEADLAWLNEYLLAKLVCRFKCPVITGIGHERDKTILDEYAHLSLGTPSMVIAHIRDVITLRASAGHENWITIVQTVLARLASADASVMLQHSDIIALAHAKIATAEYSTSKNADAVFSGTSKQIAIAAEKIDALHGGIESAALAKLDIAAATSKHLMQSINDRAVAAINVIDVNASNDFDAIILAARRSIDGVDEHIGAYWHGLLGAVETLSQSSATEVDRLFADVRFYAGKTVNDAETSTKDLMAGILAHGVEPTLRRGFAIVKSDGKPVSTKAAAETIQGDLEITFTDGSITVTQGASNG